jgi:ABC-2 type transport system permease protein
VKLPRTVRAFPALLRIGLAETVAYRAEFLIWMLTTTLPLVMLGLWTSVASEAPFRGFASSDFVAYYLAALIVRNLTGSWVGWQLNEEIRQGQLSMRLLRPLHPFAAYAGSHLAAVPLRALVATPVAVIMLISSARGVLAHTPGDLALFVLAVAGAWLLTFTVLVSIGTAAFWMQRSMGLHDIYFGVYAILSGYLVPLELMPRWVRVIAANAPFRHMLSTPVEILIGRVHGQGALELVAAQWTWALGGVVFCLALWSRGIKRYEAYGA